MGRRTRMCYLLHTCDPLACCLECVNLCVLCDYYINLHVHLCMCVYVTDMSI